MSTSVTNSTIKLSRLAKTFLSYLGLTVFFFIFSRVYEGFSYGEVSNFMHYLFLVPAIGGGLIVLLQLLFPHLSRLGYNLWNSAVATISAGFLLRGIVNLSGRSTSLDQFYWYIGGGFLLLFLFSLLIPNNFHVDSS
nr:hypothetical protein [Streptococcus gallinaceus]